MIYVGLLTRFSRKFIASRKTSAASLSIDSGNTFASVDPYIDNIAARRSAENGFIFFL